MEKRKVIKSEYMENILKKKDYKNLNEVELEYVRNGGFYLRGDFNSK